MKLSFSDLMRSESMWTRSAYWRVLLLLFCCSIYFSGAGGRSTLNAQTPIAVNLGIWDQQCAGLHFESMSPADGQTFNGVLGWQSSFSSTAPAPNQTAGIWIWVRVFCDGSAEYYVGSVSLSVANDMWSRLACHQSREPTSYSAWEIHDGVRFKRSVPAGTFHLNHNACEPECDDEADGDGDGINDCDDDDDDGDGIDDDNDEDPHDPDPYDPDSCVMDTDGDGTPNCTDTDDDGDGTPDGEDDCNDGILCEDGNCYPFSAERAPCDCFPSDPECGDGNEDFEPDCDATNRELDTDGDGCPNYRDPQPSVPGVGPIEGPGFPCPLCFPTDGFDPNCEAADKSTDSDSDGCPNYRDKWPLHEDFGGGLNECPSCPDCEASDKTTDSDGDGCKNYLDPFPQTPDMAECGTCPEDPEDDRCEQMRRDLDGDGCPDVKDQFPTDPAEDGGCVPIDADGDGCPDWLDSEPDNSAVQGECDQPDCPCEGDDCGDCELKYEEFKTEFAALFAAFVPNFNWQSLDTYVNDNFYFDIGWHVAGQDSLLFDYKWYPSKGISYKGVFQFSATYQLGLATMKVIIGGLCTLQLVFVFWRDIRSF